MCSFTFSASTCNLGKNQNFKWVEVLASCLFTAANCESAKCLSWTAITNEASVVTGQQEFLGGYVGTNHLFQHSCPWEKTTFCSITKGEVICWCLLCNLEALRYLSEIRAWLQTSSANSGKFSSVMPLPGQFPLDRQSPPGPVQD